MKIIRLEDIEGTPRQVHCPNGGFISNRFLLEEDKMGFTVTKTFIPKGKPQHWHYKNHLEACYCISGYGILTDNRHLIQHDVVPDTMYVLDNHDSHFFQAIKDTWLLCVFNPPLKGREIHKEDGSYD